MDFSAAHAGFVIGAYALSAVVLVGLVVYVLGRDRLLRGEAAALDRQRHRDNP